MRRINLAAAKAHFSAVLAQVEAGEEVVITRPADSFDLQELFHFTNAQPMHAGPDAGTFMAELRRDARY